MADRRQRRRAAAAAPGHWAALPCDVIHTILSELPLESRIRASGVCKAWREVAQRPSLWRHIEFATHRDSTRRSEMRRLLSLAAWAQRHAAGTRSMVISARVPPDAQPAALKAVAQAVLAAHAELHHLSITTSRGFWPGSWLPRLQALRRLHLCSKEGGLSLHGDLSPLTALTALVLEARHAVTLADTVRLPPAVASCELSAIRDSLPAQLSQLSGLQRLAVRRGLVSEGVLLTEYDCLQHLTALTSLELEHQEEDAWLPPPELAALTALRHLSIAGNDCSRWPLHGSDEAFDAMLDRMPGLTSLDLSCCGLEELPQALLHAHQDDDGEEEESGLASTDTCGGGSGCGGSEDGGGPPGSSCSDDGGSSPAAARRHGVGSAAAARRPRLLRLLAHGNQLEASQMHGGHELLWFPRSVRQLSLDWHVLVQLPIMRLPPGCRSLALLGRDGAMLSLLAALPGVQQALPRLRDLLLEPEAMKALEDQRCCAAASSDGGGGSSGSESGLGISRPQLQLVGGYWRPTRLPGQPRPPPQKGVLQQLQEAGVQAREVHPHRLSATMDQLLPGGGGRSGGTGSRDGEPS